MTRHLEASERAAMTAHVVSMLSLGVALEDLERAIAEGEALLHAIETRIRNRKVAK